MPGLSSIVPSVIQLCFLSNLPTIWRNKVSKRSEHYTAIDAITFEIPRFIPPVVIFNCIPSAYDFLNSCYMYIILLSLCEHTTPFSHTLTFLESENSMHATWSTIFGPSYHDA